MINSKVQGGHQVAVNSILRDQTNRAKALNGKCEDCRHSVKDIATATRCRMKNLKIVNPFGICPLYGEKNDTSQS